MPSNYHEQLYRAAFQPFRPNTGTSYPGTTLFDIDLHQRTRFPHRNREPFVSPSTATRDIMLQNGSSHAIPPAESAAIDRLYNMVLVAKDGYYGPDLAIKCFKDLDRVFFGGWLKGNVIVSVSIPFLSLSFPGAPYSIEKYFRELMSCQSPQWTDSQNDTRWASLSTPNGQTLGFTTHPSSSSERGQCHIVLNAETILLNTYPATISPFQSMMSTLLHEMVHAFEHVRCAPRGFQGGDSHDSHFRSRISVVHERAKRVLGVNAIEVGENYQQCHVFEDMGSRRRDGNVSGGSRRQSVSGMQSGGGRQSVGGSGRRRQSVWGQGSGSRVDNGRSRQGGSGSERGRHEVEVSCSVM